MLAKEIAAMENLCHSNIIKLYEVIETYSKIHLVLECATGGELFYKVSTEGKMQEGEARILFGQVVSAVQYLHSKGFVHRDIKAENVFYAGPKCVKLGDFGFSTQLSRGPNEHLNTFCGSPPYAAPELFRDQHYIGRSVDAWALGVLLFFIVTGNMPFRASTVIALKNNILEGKYLIPSHVSDACAYLIESALQQSPHDRIPIDEISKSRWMLGVDIKRVSFAQDRFVVQPTIGHDLTPLHSLESKARKKMETYGIGAKMLIDNAPISSRSAVIGIYRILVNRYQQEVIWEDFKGSTSSNRTTKSVSKTCVLL